MTSTRSTLLLNTTAITATTTSSCDDTPRSSRSSSSPPLTPTTCLSNHPLASPESLYRDAALSDPPSHSSSSSPRGFLILPTLARFRLLSTDAIWTTPTNSSSSPPPPPPPPLPSSSAITTPTSVRKTSIVAAAAPSPTSQTVPDSLNYSNSATGTTSAGTTNIHYSHSAFSGGKRPRPQGTAFRSRSNEIPRKSSENLMSPEIPPEQANLLPTQPITVPEPPRMAPQSPLALEIPPDHAAAIKDDDNETTVSSLSNDSRRRRGIYRAQQQPYPGLPPRPAHYPTPPLPLAPLVGGVEPPFFVHEERFVPPAEIFVPCRSRHDTDTLSIPDWLRDDDNNVKVNEMDDNRHDITTDKTEPWASDRIMPRRKSPPPPPLDTQAASPVMPRPSFGKHESSLPTDRTPQQQRFLGFGGRTHPSQTPPPPPPAVTDPSSHSSCTSSVTSLGSTCSAPATIAVAYAANASMDKDEWNSDNNNNNDHRETQPIPLRQRACSTGALLLDQTKNKLVRMASAATRKSGKDLATTVKKVAKSPSQKKLSGLPPLHPSAMPRPVLTKHKTCPTTRTVTAPGLMGLEQSALSAQPTRNTTTGGTAITSSILVPIPARTRAATTGVLHQQPETSWSFRTAESRDGEMSPYHGSDRLLGNRPRRRLPRGTPSVISVGTLVGQSTWLAASPNYSSWSSAALHHPSSMDHAFPAGDATGLGGDEPTIVMISSASDSPEYHSCTMRANRRLESILDVSRGSYAGRNSRWRKELSYVWQRLSMRRRQSFHHSSSSSFKRRNHRRSEQGRKQRRQGNRKTDVELLRNSAGCLT